MCHAKQAVVLAKQRSNTGSRTQGVIPESSDDEAIRLPYDGCLATFQCYLVPYGEGSVFWRFVAGSTCGWTF